MSIRTACRPTASLASALLGIGLLATPLAGSAAPIIKPDVSNQRCKLIPKDSMDEYLRVHDVNFSAPGLTAPVKPGETLKDEQPIKVEYKAAKDANLNYQIGWIGNCGVYYGGVIGLREDERGSGHWAGIVSTSTAGSVIPDGTPAVIMITEVVAEPKAKGAGLFALPKLKTTTIGEYTIRINPPKD